MQLAAVSLGYVGTRVFGPFGGGYRVTVRMADAGGLSVGAQVTYRCVPAGEVESITLEPSYVRVILELDGTHRLSANAAASVVMDSAIPIQHVDLRPSSPADPYLRDGNVVTAANPPRGRRRTCVRWWTTVWCCCRRCVPTNRACPTCWPMCASSGSSLPSLAATAREVTGEVRAATPASSIRARGWAETVLPLLSGSQLDYHCPADMPGLRQRGAANAPRPGVPAAPQVTAYDPATRTTVGPDGVPFTIGTSGGQNAVLGPRSWYALLLQGAS